MTDNVKLIAPNAIFLAYLEHLTSLCANRDISCEVLLPENEPHDHEAGRNVANVVTLPTGVNIEKAGSTRFAEKHIQRFKALQQKLREVIHKP